MRFIRAILSSDFELDPVFYGFTIPRGTQIIVDLDEEIGYVPGLDMHIDLENDVCYHQLEILKTTASMTTTTMLDMLDMPESA